MFRLIPRDVKFFEMFQEAANNIHCGAGLLVKMMENFHDPAKQAEEIKKIEHKGDTITHKIFQKLNQTFITPIDREDIHVLAGALDDVLDFIEAVSDRMLIYRIQEPTEEAKELARIIHLSTSEIVKGINLLKDMGNVGPFCIEINRLENEADRLTRNAVGQLFHNGQDPLNVIKWKDLYENLEEATDRCEDVANTMESIMLKHA